LRDEPEPPPRAVRIRPIDSSYLAHGDSFPPSAAHNRSYFAVRETAILAVFRRWGQPRQLKGRYVFGDFTRILNFPSGPDNYGRLFHPQEKPFQTKGLYTSRSSRGCPSRPPAWA
jgi:hypothetical protein